MIQAVEEGLSSDGIETERAFDPAAEGHCGVEVPPLPLLLVGVGCEVIVGEARPPTHHCGELAHREVSGLLDQRVHMLSEQRLAVR